MSPKETGVKKALYVLLAIAVVWFVYPRTERVRLGPGVFAPDPPTQEKIASPEKFEFEDHTITPLARFHIRAKVLSRRNYWWGREADLSPVDLALGWGRMSDESVVDRIEIWQSGRWYRWQTDAFPIPRDEIETHVHGPHRGVLRQPRAGGREGRLALGQFPEPQGHGRPFVRAGLRGGVHRARGGGLGAVAARN
jgi:hypothetical protein